MAIGLVYLVTARSVFNYDHDTSCYVGLAESLAQGHGYVFDGRFHTQFPPGLPLLLAPFVWLVGPAFGVLYRVVAFVGLAGLLVTYGYVASRGGQRRGLTVALFLGLSGTYYLYAAGQVFSDVPYLALSLGFVWWVERTVVHPETARSASWTLAGMALLLAALLMRTIGFALLGGLALTVLHLWRRRPRTGGAGPPRALTLALAAGALYVPLWSWVTYLKARPYPGEFRVTYLSQIRMANPHQPDLGAASLAQVVMRLPGNVAREAAHIAEILTNLSWLKVDWYSPLLLGAAVLCAIGGWAELRRRPPIAGWYVLCYMVVLLLWPYDELQRFLLPIAPLLLLFAWEGLRSLTARAQQWRVDRLGRWGLGLGIVGLLFAALSTRPWTGAASRQDMLAVAAWVLLGIVSLALLVAKDRVRLDDLVRRARRPLAAAYAVGYLALGIAQIGRKAADNLRPDPSASRWSSARQASDWLATNAPRGAVVMAQDDAAIHFSTGLRTLPLPSTAKPEILRAALDSGRPRFVVINDPLPFPYFNPVEPERLEIMRRVFPDAFREAGTYRGGRIYEFTPAPAPGAR